MLVYEMFQLWLMHQSIPAVLSPPPPAPLGEPWALAFFFTLDGKFPGWGLLSCQILQGGDEKKEGKCPVLRQLAQSNSAI